MMKILCILNPIAGGGRTAGRVTSAIHNTFRETNATYEIVSTQKKGDGVALSGKAAKEEYTLVVAIGGDGTVNEVATGLVGTNTALGIIPVGSGNGLARGLRIPLDYQEACQLLLCGKKRKIDVGQVCGRYFFATSGIGFDAHVGKVYNERPGHSRGLLPYVQLAITEYSKYTPQEVTLDCNGKTFTYTPFVLTVANVEQYGSGAIIAPRAVPNDELFDVIIIPRSHVFQIIYHLPKLFLGTMDTFPDFKTHKTKSLSITRSSPGPIHVDGEAFIAGKVMEYSLLPHALSVQVDEEAFEARNIKKTVETTSDSVVDIIEKLTRLKERGVLTTEEFEAQKQKLLDQL